MQKYCSLEKEVISNMGYFISGWPNGKNQMYIRYKQAQINFAKELKLITLFYSEFCLGFLTAIRL